MLYGLLVDPKALLVTSTGWGLAPELLLVIFLQCHYLLRQLRGAAGHP